VEEGDVIRIKRESGLIEQNVAIKDKKLKAQINGKLNDISSADENKSKISL
jgi:hypothetical protein